MRGVRLPVKFGKRGGPLQYSLNEPGKLDVEYYRFSNKGKRRFAGYAKYKAYVGYNRAGSASGSPISSRSGALRGRAAGHRRRQQHVEAEEAAIPDLVAGPHRRGGRADP